MDQKSIFEVFFLRDFNTFLYKYPQNSNFFRRKRSNLSKLASIINKISYWLAWEKILGHLVKKLINFFSFQKNTLFSQVVVGSKQSLSFFIRFAMFTGSPNRLRKRFFHLVKRNECPNISIFLEIQLKSTFKTLIFFEMSDPGPTVQRAEKRRISSLKQTTTERESKQTRGRKYTQQQACDTSGGLFICCDKLELAISIPCII